MKLLKNGKVLINKELIKKDLLINKSIIKEVKDNIDSDLDYIDLEGHYVLPGFIESHCHGGDGIDVNAASKEDYKKISKFFASHGVTGFLPSILTDTEDQTLWCIDQITQAMEDNLPGAKLLGIHLEGPFLNPKFKGAMPENLLKKPDINLVKKYQDRAKGNIKYITISPELLEDMDFIKELRELGIVVALGHSDATFNETVKAIDKGAESFTHLMNTMRPIHQHEIGIAGAALMADIYAEIIVDGFHLNKNTVKFIEKNKGYEKLILVTDCIMAAGLPDGKYKLGVNDVTVSDGDARLTSDGTRAGSRLCKGNGYENKGNNRRSISRC